MGACVNAWVAEDSDVMDSDFATEASRSEACKCLQQCLQDIGARLCHKQ